MVALYGLLRGESGVDAGDGYRGGAHENALVAHGHAHASGVRSRSTQSHAHAGGGRVSTSVTPLPEASRAPQ